MGVRDDGTLAAWGWAAHGNIFSGIPSGDDFIAVSAAYHHALALRSDGTVVAWGEGTTGNPSSPLQVPSGQFIKIAAGEEVSAGIRADGTIAVWGWNYCFDPTQGAPGSSDTFTEISGSGHHFLALRSDGSLYGWRPSSFCNSSPYTCCGQATPPSGAFGSPAKFAAAHVHSLALLSDGSFHGWGFNNWGQTGVAPSQWPSGQYVAPPSVMPAFEMATGGYFHGVGVKLSDGELIAWGRDDDCQSQPPSGVPTYGRYLRLSSAYNPWNRHPRFDLLRELRSKHGHSGAHRQRLSVLPQHVRRG